VNWRAFGALVRREIRRGRRSIVSFTLVAAVAISLAALTTPEIAVLPGTLSILAAMLVIFSPLGDLRNDKTLGHLEFDRVLPLSHRTIGAARLLGAAVRTLPIVLLVPPLLIALNRGHAVGLVTLMLLTATPVAAWMLLTAAMWALMAVNIRWNFRGLWWLPLTLVFGPRILISMLPPAAKDALSDVAARIGGAIISFASTAGGSAVAVAVVLAIPVAGFFTAVSLYASGLERYRYDDSAAVPMRTPPPRRELGAIGRGPLLAVTRYCIRLATEQSRRRLVLLVVFVAVLLFGSPVLKDYARLYVRALAALIPGGIALQLGSARARGYLEGMQQLPHPAMTIAGGYLFAIAILAVPGTSVWVLARAVTGEPPTVANVLSLFAWLVMWSWLASVATVWLTSRRTWMIASVSALGLGGWALYARLDRFVHGIATAATSFNTFRLHAGAAFPIILCLALLAGALPLFARALSEYEFRGGAKGSGY
jgi:hypothetical protein